jgi:RNA polymerase sigma factor (sigma-70 family)
LIQEVATTQVLHLDTLLNVHGRLGNREYHVPVSLSRPSDMSDHPSAGSAPDVASSEGGRDADSSFVLVLRARTGDDEALGRLCARYLPRLQRWAHGRLPVWARGGLETQDLAQEALFQAVRHIRTFEPRHEGAFQAYVRQALLNRIRDAIRRSRTRGQTDTLDAERPSTGPSPLEEAIGQQALEKYEAAMERLRPEDREAIIARIELGLEYAEVAEALGKPSIAAAHMAVSRALVKLAKEMASGQRT